MTIEELADKIDVRFDKMEGIVATINTTVALHAQSISNHDRESKEFRERINRLERIMWASLGAGAAAGGGVGACIARIFT